MRVRFLLLALATTSLVLARSQGITTACKSNLKNIGTALEMYASDFSGEFPTRLALLTPNYLKTIPTCPSVGSDTYSRSYVRLHKPDHFAVCCVGQNHLKWGYPLNSPAFTSAEGLIDKVPPAVDLANCQRQLKAIGERLAAQSAPPQKLPPDVPTCAGQPYIYCLSPTGFQLHCGPLNHLADEIKPFYPMFENGHVATRRLEIDRPVTRNYEVRRMWSVGGACLGVLLAGLLSLVWLRRRRPA